MLGRQAGWLSVFGKNFKIVIFSDTINTILNIIIVKLCMMVVLIELTLLYHFQWPWSCFKVTAMSNSFHILIRLSWNFVWLLSTSCKSWIYHYFWLRTCWREIIDIISSFEKIINVSFFSDTIERRSFILCMIITFLGFYIVIQGLMTLTLFQGYRFVRNRNCKLLVLGCCPL